MFAKASFIRELGMELTGVGEGWCETVLTPKSSHQQQHGFVHAAVVTALADHTAGCAAGTALSPGQDVITVEIKVSFLRPAAAPRLRARGAVLRAGKNLIFAESEVFGVQDGGEKLVAKAMATLSVITNEKLEQNNSRSS
ncbi:MAG: PaaI family thioesterase [Acidobacteriales bacterium]|nr:PaaI family thioesterase [Terriglobales bacterium]